MISISRAPQSASAVTQVTAPNAAVDVVGFDRVKTILDGLITRWTEAQGYPPHVEAHGNSFGWDTREKLLDAEAFGNRLIDPSMIGNGRAKDTWLIRILTGDVGSFSRMPSGGPYATDEEIATIARWIDAGAPATAPSANSSSMLEGVSDRVRQFAQRNSPLAPTAFAPQFALRTPVQS